MPFVVDLVSAGYFSLELLIFVSQFRLFYIFWILLSVASSANKLIQPIELLNYAYDSFCDFASVENKGRIQYSI